MCAYRMIIPLFNRSCSIVDGGSYIRLPALYFSCLVNSGGYGCRGQVLVNNSQCSNLYTLMKGMSSDAVKGKLFIPMMP